MRTLVIGDIHGAGLALKQVLERCEFDYENDFLITIGDIVDGWEDSYMCVEELLKIENRIDIIGNHDNWFSSFIESGVHGENWGHGGLSTAKSYARAAGIDLLIQKQTNEYFEPTDTYILNLNSGDVPDSHKRFFRGQHKYYKDFDGNLFIHGGFSRHNPLREQLTYVFMWDRHLITQAMSAKSTGTKLKFVEEFNQIFLGHTATSNWGTDKPLHADKVWNVDTGAGGGGKLTIMDIHTNEYWQSDSVPSLYPDDEHNLRNK
jgi:serine/threonine protein phosphatase 1